MFVKQIPSSVDVDFPLREYDTDDLMVAAELYCSELGLDEPVGYKHVAQTIFILLKQSSKSESNAIGAFDIYEGRTGIES